jgi:hypothetical protein
MPRGEFKHRYWFFADRHSKVQTSHGLMAFFENISYGEPIFTDFSNVGEGVQYRCFN